jgi:hypothetical protein
VKLPEDNAILLSIINMKLRDGENFEDVCADMDVDCEEVSLRLKSFGCVFDERTNSFKQV